MLIYIIIIIGLFFTAFYEIIFNISPTTKKKIFWSWVICLILFKGLRWDTGTDWSQYHSVFYESWWNNIFTFWRYGINTSYLEPGYVFLNTLIRTFLPHYTFFLLITNAFILYVFAKSIYNNLPQYQLVGLAILTVSTELFPVRQTLTFAILCYSMKYVLNGNLWKYLLCCLICFTIHRSSLLFVPFYFIFRTEFKFWRSILIYIVVIICSELMYRLFDLFNTSSLLILLTGGITETYNASQLALMNQEEYERSSVFITYTNSLIQMSLFSYTLKYMKQHLDLDDKHIILMNLVLNAYLTLICFNAIGMNPGFDSIYRMANALWVAYPFCIVFTIYVFIKKKLKLIALAIFILSFYIKYNTMPFMRPKSETYYLFVPYKSFLDQNQPIRSGYWYY